MTYRPRTAQEIFDALLGGVLARSPLRDVYQGVLSILLRGFAEQIAELDQRLRAIRDAFTVAGAAGTDLDARAGDFPSPLTRRGAVAASGAVLSLIRAESAAAATLAAGAIFARADGVQYRTLDPVAFDVGAAGAADVRVVALRPGVGGNCGAGEIVQVIRASVALASVTNTRGLDNGADGESDEAFRARLQTHLARLSRTTPDALLSLALAYVAPTDGTAARFAFVAEDAPGSAVLVIDDGSGSAGGSRAGAFVAATVPDSGAPVLWHEAPATDPIAAIEVERGSDVFFLTAGLDFRSLPEQGIVDVLPGRLLPGDIWKIRDYRVFTGLVADLQNEINGDPSDRERYPGWRAVGCRMRVLPALVEFLALDLRVLPRSGVSFSAAAPAAREAVVRYLQSLAPGATLYVARLVAALLADADLVSVSVFAAGTQTPLPDQVPTTARHAIRARAADIRTVA